jgi:hypothetical protein
MKRNETLRKHSHGVGSGSYHDARTAMRSDATRSSALAYSCGAVLAGSAPGSCAQRGRVTRSD